MCSIVFDNVINLEVCGFPQKHRNANVLRTEHDFLVHYILQAIASFVSGDKLQLKKNI